MNHKTLVTLSVIVLATILTGVGTITTVIFSTPKDIGPSGVTFWFITLMLFMSGIITIFSFLWKIRKTKNREKSQSALYASMRTAVIISTASVVLLALISLRSFNIRDFILLALTVVIVEFYFRTRQA